MRNNSISCYFCNKNHNCRRCPLEAKIAPKLKKEIGIFWEKFVSAHIPCKKCGNKLTVLGNNTPSLDLVCSRCAEPYEVKSKCISAKTIPDDLIFNHGNYFDYIRRQEDKLNFFLIIYKVDRKNKVVTIRKVLYVSNNEVKADNTFRIEKKNNSTLSLIIIPNYNNLNEIPLHKNFTYSFKTLVDKLVNDG